jgi:acetyl esterase/lipase
MTSKEYKAFYREILAKAKLPQDEIALNGRAFEAVMAAFPEIPDVRFETLNIGDLPAAWVFAPETSRQRMLLYFFGGGYTSGSIQSYKPFLGRLSAAAKSAILAVNYRLAPEHPFPAALEDALASYRWLLHRPYARSKICIAGHSAGGGLALALLLKLKLEKISMPAAAVCVAPWVDLAMKGESIQSNVGKDILTIQRLTWAAEKYAGGHNRTDPLLSPLYGNLEGLPPLLIQTGSFDLLHSEALEFAKKAKASGVDVTLESAPEMIHCWNLFAPRFPEAEESLLKIGKFLNQVM